MGVRRAETFSWAARGARDLNVYRSAVRQPATAVRRLPPLRGRHDRPASRPGLLPALRPEACGGASSRTHRSARSTPPRACARRGYEVALFDAMLASRRRSGRRRSTASGRGSRCCTRTASTTSPRCACCACAQAALSMMAAARERGIPAIVAGSDATDHPDIYLDAGAHARRRRRRRGDARRGARRHDRVGGAGALGRCAGICMRGANGADRTDAGRASFVGDLDALPRPAWDLVDVERYRRIWLEHHGYFSMNIATTRGCPYHCNWCAKPIYGQRYTARTPGERRRRDRVAEACVPSRSSLDRRRHLRAEAGLDRALRAISVDRARCRRARSSACCAPTASPTATAEALWTRRVPDRLDRRRVGIAARCSTRWRRASAWSRSTRPRARLRAAGIEVGFFLQFGYPGETRDDIEQTLADGPRRAGPTISASRCRIRCRARRSTNGSRRSSATSRTGSTPTISR